MEKNTRITMKQYTTPEQTAKLIELGFDKPKNERWVLDVANESTPSIQNIVKRQDYSIGELLSILPSTVGKDYDLHIESSVTKWYVAYYWIGNGGEYYIKYEFSACELIDALYMMILRLKEEEVI